MIETNAMDISILLSRIQFGFTIGFHILFPTLNIGLAVFLSIMETLWVRTHDRVYYKIIRFWTRVFAITFGMGVVSGVVMAYELGTNFGQFTNAIGGILGPLFTYEVLTAFFLEAGFLGVMLFGWHRVTPKMHLWATYLVTIGTTISAFWIMSANSWMQTPAGFELINEKYIATSWIQAIFNPSFLVRFVHMILASYVTTCFVIAGVSAWYLLNKRFEPSSQRCLNFVITAALFLTPAQIILGDIVGLKMLEHQPIKTAAMEGLWETSKGVPAILFAIPDTKNETNKFEIGIPKLASFINTHDWDGEMVGLKSVAPEDRPIVTTVFYSFRIMVAIGFLFFVMAVYGWWLKRRGKLFSARRFLRLCVLATPLGFFATIAGWMVAESGRQPWTIYGFMRTADAASAVSHYQVMISLALFVSIYCVILAFYFYYVFRMLQVGPLIHHPHLPEEEGPPMFQYMSGEDEEHTIIGHNLAHMEGETQPTADTDSQVGQNKEPKDE